MKKPALIILLLCYFGKTAFTQGPAKMDSLQRAYQTAKTDTNKTRIINDLVNAYLYQDAKKAKAYIDEGLQLSKHLKHKKGIALFYYQAGVYFSFTPKKDSSEWAYRKSLSYIQDDFSAKRKAISGLGILASDKGELDKADSLLKEALQYDILLKDSVGIAISYNQIGRISQMKGHFQIAQNYILKSVRILEKTEDEIRLADAYNSLAAIEMRQKNYKSSIPYNEKAVEIYTKFKDDYFLPQSYLDLGIAYSNTNQPTKALAYWQKAIRLTQEKGLTGMGASVYHNLAKYYLDKKEYSLATKEANQSLALAEKSGNKYKVVQAQNVLSQIYNLTKKHQKALNYSNLAVNGAKEVNNAISLLTALEQRSKANESLGNYQLAAADLTDRIALQDSIFNMDKNREIEEQRAIFDLERKESEIKNLNLEVEKNKLQKTLYTGGIMTLIALMGLGYFSFHQRAKRKNAEFEKREELMKNELAFKKKELLSQTLHLVNKNTLIQDLQTDLISLKKTSESQTKEINKIIKNLKQDTTSDANWEIFKAYFNEVHDSFDQKLKLVSNEVTDNDIRLAAFLKMKLSTKEIAAMLNVQPDSVLKSKYRLKKKLQLEKDDDFNRYLEEI